ncbi:zinc finger MYM-type protein 1-like [Olea europaea var. sylvestris]|uniref:zinc finger MYM-type protein 1-like n=1 Tax=Olea europaea var. sylvestris TaxID=158386 RepID=UPI000C1D57F6|nr:zinc finger MYM-type protein 1-like [Olea europaea var. sylvestris]
MDEKSYVTLTELKNNNSMDKIFYVPKVAYTISLCYPLLSNEQNIYYWEFAIVISLRNASTQRGGAAARAGSVRICKAAGLKNRRTLKKEDEDGAAQPHSRVQGPAKDESREAVAKNFEFPPNYQTLFLNPHFFLLQIHTTNFRHHHQTFGPVNVREVINGILEWKSENLKKGIKNFIIILLLFLRKTIPNSSTSSCGSSPATDSSQAQELLNNTKKSQAQFNMDDLVSDPGIRPPIESYDHNIRDVVRMSYLEKGPCQPYEHDFSRRPMGNDNRCFRKEWFSEFHWLEYSIEKDAAYCLHCYLFKPDRGGQGGGHIFTKTGFRDWKHKKTLKDHVGLFDSSHNQAFAKCTNLMNQKQSISYVISSQSSSQQQSYRTKLIAVLDYTRLLFMQGLSFRGHDESKESLNRGNLIELLNWYAARCNEIKEVLFSNAHGNDQMTSPTIQKDLINCCAVETTRAIINEIGDSLFSILVDEARDNSVKEQMAVVLRFVDKSGRVKERFWDAIDAMFSTHGLSISSLRGQGYDGASNTSGEFNGLKALILRENPHAMYVHCFAHQLQLAIISVARRNCMVGDFLDVLAIIVNLVGASCKRVDALRTSYQANILEKLNTGELTGGSGQFQEMSLARPDVLENISEDGVHSDQKSSALRQMNNMQGFEFVFSLHFMFEILAITDDLSQALQKKDQDIQNAMRLLNLCKCALQNLRETGWDTLFSRVIEFCVDRHILVPNMEDIVVVKGRPRRVAQQVTYFHRFYVDLYCHVIDSILQELNDRFPETTIELFTCISCLSQRDSFVAFDKDKLLRLAQFYPLDFNSEELLLLRPQLDKFLLLVRMHEAFFNINSISCVAQKLIETRSFCYFPLVYRLLTLGLIFVERVFSAMNLIKSDLCNKMGDVWLNDNLVVYVEKAIFKQFEKGGNIATFSNHETP